MAIFKEFIYRVNTPSHSQILHLFFRMQKCEILTCINFPQNNLYSYNIIADNLRKIHISENREKIAVQRLIYQRVN